jgi:DNA polymerase-3 subunit alpha
MTTRNVRPFVHLRVFSSYSLGLGLSSPGDVCRHAHRTGFGAVALTDVSGTYGFVEFHRAARETGVKPVYGTLVFLDWGAAPSANEPVQSLIVLALDRNGLRNVCATATASAVRRERRERLLYTHLDGFTDGVVAITRVQPRDSGVSFEHLLGPLHDLYGDRLFLELHPGGPESQRSSQTIAADVATALGVSCVLTQDVRFVGPPRPQLLDLMASLDESGFEHRVFSDRRAGDASPDHGMASEADISPAFDEFPEAYTNASLIASLVQPDLFELLEEPPTPGTEREMFFTTASGALRARIRALDDRAGEALPAAERERNRARVDHELDLIESVGLEPTMTRFERLAGLMREIGTRLGPATGLSVQSRCAYLLGITAFDPYVLDARFEPAFEARDPWGSVFDIQISPEDRPAVLAIVNRAFAGASVGYVPSVEHITAARSMRMVAKWLGTPPEEIEEAVKAATRFQGVTLRRLAEDNRAFGALYRRSAAFRDLVTHAASVEGLPFGFTRMKRTVVVSPRPLRDFFGYTVSPTTGDHFVQATRDSFPLGAVLRIDLSLLRLLASLPAATSSGAADAGVYRLVESGDLEGVHLLEGAPGRLAPKFGIRSFEDLTHFVALLRRRGSGMSLAGRLSAFRGEPRPVPAAAQVGDVLESTNGWLLFPDQLRDVVVGLTGWSRTEATRFVAGLADRSPGNLAAMRQELFKQTVEQSVSLEDATAWFNRLVHEAAQAIDRQRIIAECLLTERGLVAKISGAGSIPAPRDADDAPEIAPVELVPPLELTQPIEKSQPSLLRDDPPPPSTVKVESGRNSRRGFVVLRSISEFYPHPISAPVELAGRIRNLQTFKTSSNRKVGYFELIDTSGSVRVFVPAAVLARYEALMQDGSDVMVRGTVRQRDGRRVLDALEIEGNEGGVDLGQASADKSSTRDP